MLGVASVGAEGASGVAMGAWQRSVLGGFYAAAGATKTTCAHPSQLGGSPFKSVGLAVRTLSREIAERCGLLLVQ